METIAVNLSSKPRRESLNGRNYLVADATLIVPGVLSGSQGPLLYPPSEVARNAADWNGIPITLGHPKDDNGNDTSARDPHILERYWIGNVYRTSVNGKLTSEAWIDEEAVNGRNPNIHRQLLNGAPVELSTGLYTDNEPAPEGSVHNGKSYDAVARNYRPDHLAVLETDKGACALSDGCGINVNQRNIVQRFWDWLTKNKQEQETDPPEREISMDKKKAIDFLTSNCDCWKGEDGKKALNQLSDPQLKQLVNSARVVLVVNQARTRKRGPGVPLWNQEDEAATGVDIQALAELFGITTDPGADPAAFIGELKAKLEEVTAKLGAPMEPLPVEEPLPEGEVPSENIIYGEDCTGGDNDDPECRAMFAAQNRAGTTNKRRRTLPIARPVKVPTANEWLAQAPPEVQSVVKNALEMERREKVQVIRRLTANVAPERRDAKAKWLASRSLDELRGMVELLPQEQTVQPVANWFGAAGAPAQDERDDSDNLLPVFNVDFEEMASPKLRKQRSA